MRGTRHAGSGAASRATTVALPIVSIAAIALVMLLPDLGPKPTGPEPVTAYHARITALLPAHQPNPEDPSGGFLPDARVVILEGPESGREIGAYLEGPGGQQTSSGYRVGEDVVVTETAVPDGQPFVAVSDRWRLSQLALLGVVFALGVVLVGGWRGLRALLALALTIAVVVRVLVPLLLAGVPPIPVAVAIATAMTIVTIGLTEGFTRASVAAILGTTTALGLTALLAAVATVASGFTNAAGTDLAYVQTATGEALDLRGLLLAAFMLGALGVLDDVAVTQAATVHALVTTAGLAGRRLYASAFNVGRSHIAATVNTLFLAYVGASLPLLVLFALNRQPVALTLNSEVVSVEIVRTLVGSLGIVAAVPLTTAIAAWLVPGTPLIAHAHPETPTIGTVLRRPLVALVLGLALLGTAMGGAMAGLAPLTAFAPGEPLTPTVLRPSGAPTATTGATQLPSEEPLPSDEPLPSASGDGQVPSLVPVIEVGDTMTVTDGADTAEVSVVERRVSSNTSGPLVVDVRIRYSTARGFTVKPSTWVALASDGDDVTASATSPSPQLTAGRIAPGSSREGWLEYRIPSRGDSLFLDYRLPDGSTFFSVTMYDDTP